MEFENEFTVPAAPEKTWDALMDVDRMARCMPGATLLENHDDRMVGRLQVKVGPIRMSYRGSAQFLERDPAARRLVLTAKGREERGAGTAGLTVTASLSPTDGGQTTVQVRTDLDVSGKPAQFGRGVLAEVGTAIVNEFAARLAAELQATPGDPAPATTADSRSEPRTEPTRPSDDGDALDLAGLAGGPLAKRIGVGLAGGLGALALLLLLRRQSRPLVTVVYVGEAPGRSGR